MSDRELLELAAKAAGIKLRWWDNSRNGLRVCNDTGSVCKRLHWNPIEDDRDALRLAVKLGIDIEVNHESKTASTRWLNKKGNPASVTDYLTVYFGDGDPYAATRRAITRAAAEIGKAML